MRYAIIQDGTVVNVAEIDYHIATKYFTNAVPSNAAGIGDEYHDEKFWRDGSVVKDISDLYCDAATEANDLQTAFKPMISLAAQSDATATADTIGNTAPYVSDGVWTPGETYAKDAVLEHHGAYWFVRQQVLALEHQPPDGNGMTAIYVPVPQTYMGRIVWQMNILCDRDAIVWNPAKTQLYRAVHAGNPSTIEPGTDANMWAEYTEE